MRVDEVLQKLEAAKPNLRELVNLRYFGECSLAETAELLSRSESTVTREGRFGPRAAGGKGNGVAREVRASVEALPGCDRGSRSGAVWAHDRNGAGYRRGFGYHGPVLYRIRSSAAGADWRFELW